jgi:hypothetical protein
MNPINGAKFEVVCKSFFAKRGMELERPFVVPVGVSEYQKDHKFDLGSEKLKVIIECKRHTWTEGRNAPSAKMTTWNEAMYYFFLAPSDYRKILFVLKDEKDGRTLAHYYISRHRELIPDDVEIWEYDLLTEKAEEVYKSEKYLQPHKTPTSSIRSSHGKYHNLFLHLSKSNAKNVTIGFEKLQELVSLPASAAKHRAWWSNGGHGHSYAWLDAGYEVDSVELGREVTFRRIVNLKQPTTVKGYINRNRQINLGRVEPLTRGTDHEQYVYKILCGHCGKDYGANGSDIFQRKCPSCQGGKPGL